MSKKVGKRRSNCPLAFGLDGFGDKWSLLIIRDIVFGGKRHYGEFLDSGEKISTNILADRLSRLESQKILEKEKDPQNSTKYLYRLTEKGNDLIPILLEIILWGAKYDAETGAPREFIDRALKDKEGMVKSIRKGLKKY